MKIRSFVLIVITFLAAWMNIPPAVSADPDPTNVENDPRNLSIEEKIGQLFLLGFTETDLTQDFKTFLGQTKPGGLILFGRNIKTPTQIKTLLFNIQKFVKEQNLPPEFLAVDQEGGLVTRIKSYPFPPSAMAIGQLANAEYSYGIARGIGRMLRAIGFNMNLAPVLDLGAKSELNFIGTRSYGDSPQIVSEMAGEAIRGLEDEHILATGKHFPGHGLISGDSHVSPLSRDIELNDLLKTDLKPFIDLQKKNLLPALMVAHIAFPKIDPSALPATYSPILLTDVLRKKMGFQGLIVTDDIEMEGAVQVGDIGQRAVRALQAGADIIMIGWNRREQKKAIQSVIAAVKSGALSEARVNESVERILRSKKRFISSYSEKEQQNPNAQEALFDPVFKSFADRIIKENIRRSLPQNTTLDLSKTFVVVSATSDFYLYFKRAYPRSFFVRISPTSRELPLSRFKNANFLIYVTGSKSAQVLHNLEPELLSRTVIVNTLTPAYVRTKDPAALEIDTYSRHIQMGKFVADELRLLQKRQFEDQQKSSQVPD